MNFEDTFVELQPEDHTVERILEIAKKYSDASGYPLESFLKDLDQRCHLYWDIFIIHENEVTAVLTGRMGLRDTKLTEQDLDDYLKRKEQTSEIKSQSIGELVDELYRKMDVSKVCITVNGDGVVLLNSAKLPTIDVSPLDADEITKVYEAMVLLEGLVQDDEDDGWGL